MEVKLIGLGKMGLNLGKNLLAHGHKVKAFDISKESIKLAQEQGMETFASIEEMIQASSNHIYYIMVPSGKPIEEITNTLLHKAPEGSYIIDGGNSHFQESINRYQRFKNNNQHFIDVGSSGGQEAAQKGLCLMVGGELMSVKHVETLFKDLSVENGYEHVGPPGAGHYVKMIHNGIEYGMMQAIAEGFEILENNQTFKELKMDQIAKVWNHGSVIRSWLVNLMQEIYEESPNLKYLSDQVDSSGEGLWTIEEALKNKIPAPVLMAALNKRYDSLQEESTAGKILNALRNKFGGHKLHQKKPK